MSGRTVKDIPPKSGRIAVITVANSGIGYEAAKALVGAGVKVIIASPNERKGAEALAKIRSATSGADIAFEMQMGANYIGHFAWTMRLLPTVFDADNPRVVTVSSLAHRSGRINFEDLQWRKNYGLGVPIASRSWRRFCSAWNSTASPPMPAIPPSGGGFGMSRSN